MLYKYSYICIYFYLFSFVETPRKFIIANLLLFIIVNLLFIFTWCFHKAKQVYCIHHANVQETYIFLFTGSLYESLPSHIQHNPIRLDLKVSPSLVCCKHCVTY